MLREHGTERKRIGLGALVLSGAVSVALICAAVILFLAYNDRAYQFSVTLVERFTGNETEYSHRIARLEELESLAAESSNGRILLELDHAIANERSRDLARQLEDALAEHQAIEAERENEIILLGLDLAISEHLYRDVILRLEAATLEIDAKGQELSVIVGLLDRPTIRNKL